MVDTNKAKEKYKGEDEIKGKNNSDIGDSENNVGDKQNNKNNKMIN